jgi:hypothetical protein
MKAKPWQIALIVVGLLVGGGLLCFELMRADPTALNTKFYLLDPASGDLYYADWDKVHFSLPAADPETGEARLIRVSNEGGHWSVLHRDIPLIGSLPGKNELIDPDGSLRHEPKSPVPYRPKKT